MRGRQLSVYHDEKERDSLNLRELRGATLVISDAHEGIKAAVRNMATLARGAVEKGCAS